MSEQHDSDLVGEIAFYQDGVAIFFDRASGMGSLTAMWQAKGGLPNKRPAYWLRTQQAQDLTNALTARLESTVQNCTIECAPDAQLNMQKRTIECAPDAQLNMQKRTIECAPDAHSIELPIVIVETRAGGNGGTWAHWQIAAAYAHYLDPAFYLAWNEWAVAHITGQPSAATPTDLEARVAALEAAAAHAALPYARSIRTAKVSHPQSQAILAVLRESAAPLSAHQIWATLTARGATTYTAKYYTVRLRRLDRTGAVRRVGHGLYVATETLELAPCAPDGRTMPWGGEP